MCIRDRLYPQVTYDGTSQVGFINSFYLKKREKLKEVKFYEAETGAQYQLFYVPVKDDGSLDIGNKQAITEKKTLDFPGYHTAKITKEILSLIHISLISYLFFELFFVLLW